MNIDFASRVPAAFVDRAPRRVAELNGRLVCDGDFYNDAVVDTNIETKGNFYEILDRKEGMRQPKRRLEDMDVAGIERCAIFGTIISSGIFGVRDAVLARHIGRAYHDALAEYCAEDPNRLKGVAVPVLQDDPTEVTREVRRAIEELGFVAIHLPSNVRGTPVTSPELRYVFELAADLDVPLLTHPSVSARGIANLGVDRSESLFVRHVITPPVQMMSALMYIVCEGILDQFPTLRVAILEGGVGWLPWFTDNLDSHHELLGYQTKIATPPSDHLRSGRLFFFADTGDRSLPLALETVGEDNFIFASDYWHWDADPFEAAPHLEARGDVTATQAEKILVDNGKRLFGWT
jgi:predicted TIM-barrel fold metal-dependent hydrolase